MTPQQALDFLANAAKHVVVLAQVEAYNQAVQVLIQAIAPKPPPKPPESAADTP